MLLKLSEAMVVARAKTSSLDNVKKLNFWGSELDDISILKRLSGLEVLVLTVNNVHSLKALQGCTSLKELYLRKNKIRDIRELENLQNLKHLISLNVAENPFCERAGSQYRASILRILPNLQKLDDLSVSDDEVAEALRPSESSTDIKDQSEHSYGSSHQNMHPGMVMIDTQSQQSRSRVWERESSNKSPMTSGMYDYQNSRSNMLIRQRTPVAPSSLSSVCQPYRGYYEGDQHFNAPASAAPLPAMCRFGSNECVGMHPMYVAQQSTAGTNRMPVPCVSAANSTERLPLTATRAPPGWHSSANILSALLNLIQELDYSGMEMVFNHLRTRMDAYIARSPRGSYQE